MSQYAQGQFSLAEKQEAKLSLFSILLIMEPFATWFAHHHILVHVYTSAPLCFCLYDVSPVEYTAKEDREYRVGIQSKPDKPNVQEKALIFVQVIRSSTIPKSKFLQSSSTYAKVFVCHLRPFSLVRICLFLFVCVERGGGGGGGGGGGCEVLCKLFDVIDKWYTNISSNEFGLSYAYTSIQMNHSKEWFCDEINLLFLFWSTVRVTSVIDDPENWILWLRTKYVTNLQLR